MIVPAADVMEVAQQALANKDSASGDTAPPNDDQQESAEAGDASDNRKKASDGKSPSTGGRAR
jgi:hypothetical protein